MHIGGHRDKPSMQNAMGEVIPRDTDIDTFADIGRHAWEVTLIQPLPRQSDIQRIHLVAH